MIWYCFSDFSSLFFRSDINSTYIITSIKIQLQQSHCNVATTNADSGFKRKILSKYHVIFCVKLYIRALFSVYKATYPQNTTATPTFWVYTFMKSSLRQHVYMLPKRNLIKLAYCIVCFKLLKIYFWIIFITIKVTITIIAFLD